MRIRVVVLALVCVLALGWLTQSSDAGFFCYCYNGIPFSEDYPVLVLGNSAFSVGYSDARHNPLWACYYVFALENPPSYERPSYFRIDERTKSEVRHDDFTNSGYDRGHMAPNATIAGRYGEAAQLETFVMSNVCPQTPQLHRTGGPWEELERLVRQWANVYEEVWVITGPIFDKDIETLALGVEIPDAFFKIVIDEVDGKPRALSFVIPQGPGPNPSLEIYLGSVNMVEILTGFDFFWALDDGQESTMEAKTPTEIWTTTTSE